MAPNDSVAIGVHDSMPVHTHSPGLKQLHDITRLVHAPIRSEGLNLNEMRVGRLQEDS
jgi:hypothetical protein